MRLVVVVVAAFGLFGADVIAQRNLKNIPDPDPQKQKAMLQLGDGLEITLFASDPVIAKPIQMSFDAKGRLWVASSSVYPQIAPGQKADDKVVVLEDTTGDGKADKHTVFADNLLIPTGVLPGDGGAYVANSTELLHLKDTNGDGKADRKKVVLSGFGTEDTHHIIHSFRWGPDGAMYLNQSIYIHSHLETPRGVKRLMAGGVWRFRPESMKLRVFNRGFVNSWGHHFDKWGQSFQTDGAYGEGINYSFPESVHVTAYQSKRILRGLNPGQPKECGLEILSGRHIPEDWRGTMITNDFRGNRVVRFKVSEEGSGYRSRQMPDVIKTKHIAFRPIAVKMGPDGAIYIADWYNPIIQHGEVDFRDKRRDKAHGRIWRITFKGRKLLKKEKIVGRPLGELLDLLKVEEDWVRLHAKLELKTRKRGEVRKAINKWVAGLDKGDAGYEHQRLEALWAFQNIDMVNEGLLRAVLGSKDGRARAAAVRVLSYWADRVSGAEDLFAKAVADDHPRVRLEAVNGVRALGTAKGMEIGMRALDKEVDRYLDFVLWRTSRLMEKIWLPGFMKGEVSFGGNARHAGFALKAIGNKAALRPLVGMLKDGKVAKGEEGGVLSLIGELGGGGELRFLYEMGVGGQLPQGVTRVEVLEALKGAGERRGAKPSGDLGGIVKLISDKDEKVKGAAMRLAGLWKVGGAKGEVVKAAMDKGGSGAVRQAAVDGLARYGDGESRKVLVGLTGKEHGIGVRMMGVVGLAAIDLKAAGETGAVVLGDAGDNVDVGGVYDAFLSRKNGPAVLAGALRGRKIGSHVATIGIRKAAAAGRKLNGLIGALEKAGGVARLTQKLDAKAMAALIEEVAKRGDAKRGEAVYRMKSILCMNCHAMAGAGGLNAPDMLSLGASAPVDYIVNSLLDPSAKIKEGYHMTVVTTKDDKVAAGLVVSDAGQTIVLRDQADKLVTIAKGNVKSKQILPTSMMPPGLMAALRRDQFVDLVRFLSELGKEGAYKAPTGRFVRRWRVLKADGRVDHQLRRSSNVFVLSGSEVLKWEAGYSRVAGDLPAGELPVFRRFGNEKYSFVKFEVEVTTAGVIGLKFHGKKGADGLEMWVGRKPVRLEGLTKVELGKGTHVVTMSLDRNVRTEGVKVELVDVEGSKGRGNVVGGK